MTARDEAVSLFSHYLEVAGVSVGPSLTRGDFQGEVGHLVDLIADHALERLDARARRDAPPPEMPKLDPVFEAVDEFRQEGRVPAECPSGWYFWDETWTFAYGPFDAENEAQEACKRYARTL